MNPYFYLPRYGRSLIASLLLLAGAGQASALDSYNPSNRQLTIPSIAIGTARFSNLIVTVGGIVSGPAGAYPTGSADSYDPGTRELTVQSVTVEGATYHNVIVAVDHLVSVGSVSGADRYIGTALSIPSVQSGSVIYTNVTLTIQVPNVIGVAGDMPVAIRDQFNAGSNKLIIPAVQMGGKVYTNVIVSVDAANILPSGGPSGGNTTTFSLGTTAVSVVASPTGTTPMPSVRFVISKYPSAGVYYAWRSIGGAVTGVDVQFDDSLQPDGSRDGTVELQFDSPDLQGSGDHASTVTLLICLDAQCHQQVAGSPQTIAATYTVTGNALPGASWDVTPLLLNLESPSTGPALTATLNVTGYNLPPYGVNLYVRQSTGGIVQSVDFQNNVQSDSYAAITVTLNLSSPAQLGPGIFNDTVTVEVCYDQACLQQAAGSPWSIPFAYTVTASEGRDYQLQILPVPATALAADPSGKNLYVATRNYSGAPSPSLLKIDPATGATLATVPLSEISSQIAVSHNGAYAYVAELNETNATALIERVNLSTMAIDLQIPFTQRDSAISDLQASPADWHAIAVSLNYVDMIGLHREVLILDDGVPRPDAFSVAAGDDSLDFMQWNAGLSTIYISDAGLLASPVTSAGLGATTQIVPFVDEDGFSGRFHQLGGLLYSDGGAVINPSKGSKAGQFVLRTPSGGSQNSSVLSEVLPDASTGNAYATYLELGEAGLLYTLESFSLSQFSPIWVARSPVQLSSPVRWGANGLAMMGAVMTSSAQYHVYLIQGAFVAPAGGNITSGRRHIAGDGATPLAASFRVKGSIH